MTSSPAALPEAASPAPHGAVHGAHRASVIHTDQLTKVYPGGEAPAVDHLDLDVRRGEILGLLGRTAPARRRLTFLALGMHNLRRKVLF